MTHVFDEATAVEPIDGGFRAHTHPAYNNMVGPFGGITAGTVVAALQAHPEAQGHPLSLTLNFAAPIKDGAWDLAVTVLRTNRTNQHFVFVLSQGDGPVASGTAVFGTRRDTWGATETPFPQVQAPEDYPEQSMPDFVEWAKNYETRFVEGSLVMDGPQDDSTTTMWLRDKPARPLDYPALASIADSFYPRIFRRRGTYAPAGTISLTTYFHASPAELEQQGAEHLLATARAARFGHGHFDQYGQVWGRNGTLLATTHQIVYYKDPQA
ncbi:acyl-CoA thioesterase [Tsukamurella pseudospumae]|uniref:Acyl-CoA thioesterase n=1 Tax=Tsukamurella pseudospumae TaxID=239498 RepID=A0A138A010_9ACTN|nr:thioesterase family protein [Tsukamurella pseudospumae]KXP03757.1 acyl-CoA thioesterase [Tsukamurella pseudospumae]